MSRLSLSIITPSYNQAEFIERTIRSVLDQKYTPLEYQVMDGGSKDGTVEILQRYAGQLKFVSEKDGGQSAALNAGIRRTSGEIIGWINSDDVYLPGAFDAVMEVFADPNVNWVVGRCPIIDRHDRRQREFITRYKEFFLRRYSYKWLQIENFISQPAVFLRRSFVDRIGLVDESFHCAMDYDWWLRMGAVSPPYFLDREVSQFRVWGEGKMSTQFERGFAEEIISMERITQGKAPVMMALHNLNRHKLNTAYRLIALAGRARKLFASG